MMDLNAGFTCSQQYKQMYCEHKDPSDNLHSSTGAGRSTTPTKQENERQRLQYNINVRKSDTTTANKGPSSNQHFMSERSKKRNSIPSIVNHLSTLLACLSPRCHGVQLF